MKAFRGFLCWKKNDFFRENTDFLKTGTRYRYGLTYDGFFILLIILKALIDRKCPHLVQTGWIPDDWPLNSLISTTVTQNKIFIIGGVILNHCWGSEVEIGNGNLTKFSWSGVSWTFLLYKLNYAHFARLFSIPADIIRDGTINSTFQIEQKRNWYFQNLTKFVFFCLWNQR